MQARTCIYFREKQSLQLVNQVHAGKVFIVANSVRTYYRVLLNVLIFFKHPADIYFKSAPSSRSVSRQYKTRLA